MGNSSNSRNDSELVGAYLKLPRWRLDEIKDYRVLIGFAGFGNVGYLSLTHFVESLDLESIAFWGGSSWYHNNRLESLLTVYKHEPTKTILVMQRVPVPVTVVPQKYWDELTQEILSWNCKEYIIIGGLREETRHYGSTDWAAYAPNPAWVHLHKVQRTFNDHLAMIGPLSAFLSFGTTMNIPVLGLLAYCELEEDPSAALVAAQEINKLCGYNLDNIISLNRFDYSFVPNIMVQMKEMEELANDSDYRNGDDDDDDMPGFDINELI